MKSLRNHGALLTAMISMFFILLMGQTTLKAYDLGGCYGDFCCRPCYNLPTYDPNTIAVTNPCRLFWECSNDVASGHIHQLVGHDPNQWRCQAAEIIRPIMQTKNCNSLDHCSGNDFYNYSCTAGNAPGYDPCILSIETNSPQCCTSHHHTECYNGDVYWYNSCGVREGLKEGCSFGCYDGDCITCTDTDEDQYYAEGGLCGDQDCNDNDNQVNPGATEICDLADNNCNSQIDEGTCVFCPEPADPQAFLNELIGKTYSYLTMVESLNGHGIPNNWYEVSGSSGSYTSPEETGFFILAHIYAEIKGIIDATTARTRVVNALNRLENDFATYDDTINQTLWTIGDDEAPPDYSSAAFDEFDQSDFDNDFQVGSDSVSDFPKELNDWSTYQTFIRYSLDANVRGDLTLTLGTLYATHSGQDKFDLNVKIKLADGSYNSIGVYSFGSGSSTYPEEIDITIPQELLLEGENIILLENNAGQYTGKWVIWDHLKLVYYKERSLYYQYYDTGNFNVTDSNIASQGNALLSVSLMTASEYYQDKSDFTLSDRMDQIVQKIDLRMFFETANNRFYHTTGQQSIWDQYSDMGRLISFIAKASNAISESEFSSNLAALADSNLYYDVVSKTSKTSSTNPEDILVNKAGWNGTVYSYFVPALFIQEQLTGYYQDTLLPSVDAQIHYCKYSNYTVTGCVAWGKSDAYDATGDYCDTYNGGPPTVANQLYNTPYESCPGVITPYAIALSLNSDEAGKMLGSLNNLAGYSGLYHPLYGFTDSINVLTGDYADRFSTLHQELLLLSLMNYTDQAIWSYLYQNLKVVETHNLMFPSDPY